MALNTGGVNRSRPLGRAGTAARRFFPKNPASGQSAIRSNPDMRAGFDLKYPTNNFAERVTAFMVSPKTATVAPAATVDLDGYAFDQNSKAIVVTQNQISFTSSDTAKATVNSAGLVTGVATGTTTITAVWGKWVAYATITVS